MSERVRSGEERPGDRSEVHAFAIAFVIGLILAFLQGSKTFVYDAETYWNLADLFVKQGHWSLLNFDSDLRGYIPALLYGGLRSLAGAVGSDGSAVVQVFNALIFALIGAVLGPRLAQLTWKKAQFTLARRLALTGLLLLFWRGYLNFPLTDFPALAAALLALLAVSRTTSIGAMLVSGIAIGVAINMRPSYLLLIPAIAVIALWNQRQAQPRATAIRQGLRLAVVAVGIIAMLLPQALVTHRHYDMWSPIPGAARNLTGVQLAGGLMLQRYEAYVGEGRDSPRMAYLDPHTTKIVAKLAPGYTVDGYGEYLDIILHHPVTTAGVFARHIINGMDQRYTTPYIEHLDTGGQRPLRAFGFLIVFLALLRLCWPAARRGLGDAQWRYPIALAITCATALPSAIETRFLLPLYLLCGLLVIAPGWPRSILGPADQPPRRRFAVPVGIFLGLVIFIAAVLLVVSGASDNLS